MRSIKLFFLIAALYDFILGVTFLFFFTHIYAYYAIELPNHAGYVQFPALLLMIFGYMFAKVSQEPQANRGLIIYGVMLKAAYCSVVFGNLWFGTIPFMWVPWACIDLVFLIAFIVTAYKLHGDVSK